MYLKKFQYNLLKIDEEKNFFFSKRYGTLTFEANIKVIIAILRKKFYVFK